MTLDPHEPRPEFLSHLEWQVRSALRRESRLSSPARRFASLRTAALVAASIMIGAAGAVASAEIQDARQRDLLLDTVRTDQILLQMRLDLAREEYETAKRRFDLGTGDRPALIAAELQMREREAAMRRLQVNMAEIQATTSVPRETLDAPVVRGRDFVRERLEIDVEVAQHALIAAERLAALARTRASVGTGDESARLRAESDLAAANSRMLDAAAKLRLRREFVAGRLRATDLPNRLRRTELNNDLHRVIAELQYAEARLTAIRKRTQVGLAGDLEVKRAEVALLELQHELKRIRTELDALGREK